MESGWYAVVPAGVAVADRGELFGLLWCRGGLGVLLDQEVGLEQDAEGAGGFSFGAVVIDEEALEDRLVELAADLGAGIAVGGVAVGQERQAAFEGVLDRLEDDLGGSQSLFGIVQCLRNAVLLLFEQVEW